MKRRNKLQQLAKKKSKKSEEASDLQDRSNEQDFQSSLICLPSYFHTHKTQR